MHKAAIETIDLSRMYGDLTVVDRINLFVPLGHVYAFLGPNGAGKSTTIRMLLGLIRPSKGSVHIFSEAVRQNHFSHLKRVGALVETPSLYSHLTGFENLEITRTLVGATRRNIDRTLSIVHLDRYANRLVREYSDGMRQRLALALALLNEPDLLILDEPTNGLDPAGIQEMRELICSFPAEYGVTVFLSSHILSEVQQVASHIGIINQGKLLFQGRLGDLEADRKGLVHVTVEDVQSALDVLRDAGFDAYRHFGNDLTVHLRTGAETADINERLVKHGIRVNKIDQDSLSLEAIFMDLTNQSQAQEGE
jgi:ABC-type multidrug transport system ATPase subunit